MPSLNDCTPLRLFVKWYKYRNQLCDVPCEKIIGSAFVKSHERILEKSKFCKRRDHPSTCFQYPQEVRRLIYTTNTTEGFNRRLRKVTKSKSLFQTDDSLLKMLYPAMMDITEKRTGRRQDWSRIHTRLSISFAERMPD